MRIIVKTTRKPVRASSIGHRFRRRNVYASISWEYFRDFEPIFDIYLPSSGEGDTMASQICTAVNTLIYRWFNDGDVFDNTYSLDGWGNDISSYANWLFSYIPKSRHILDKIYDINTTDDYSNLLANLADSLLDSEDLEKYAEKPKKGSIYKCDGPFQFEEDWGDDEW